MLAQLTQIRFLLERAAIEDAVKQISEEDLSQLETVITTWRQRVQAQQPYIDLHKEFHRILYAPSTTPC